MRILAALILLAIAADGCSASIPAPSASDVGTNALRSIRSVDASGPFGEAGVEVELFSPQAFPVRNQIAVLQIGTESFLRSRYPQSGDTHTLFFFVSTRDFAALADGGRVTLRYGTEVIPGEQVWEFGPLDKRLLNRP